MRNGPVLPTVCVHDAIFEEFFDCSVTEKDNFTDVQLDKTELSEELFYQSRDMYWDKRPKEFKLRFVGFPPIPIFFNFSECFK